MFFFPTKDGTLESPSKLQEDGLIDGVKHDTRV